MRIQVGVSNLLCFAALLLVSVAAPARADTLAYAVASAEVGSGNPFGTMNLDTGVFTLHGYTGVALVGLGEFGGALYGTGVQSGTLYKVNPANGSLTVVGSGSTILGTFGSTTAGLFALDYNMDLYSVDPATGGSTLLGPTGVPSPSLNGLSSGSSSLYYTAQWGTSSPATLYSLDTVTGAGTPIGNIPAVFGPVHANGELYAESFTLCSANISGTCGESIYAIDTSTGASTFVSNISGVPSQLIFDGLAPMAVPEPASVLLLGAGLALAFAARKRR